MNEKDFDANKHFGASWGDKPAQIKPAAPQLPGTIDDAIERANKIAAEAAVRRGRLELFAAGQPQTLACPRHPNQVRKIDLDESSRETTKESCLAGIENFIIRYTRCPECDLETRTAAKSSWLAGAGVPALLIHASFETFRIEREEDRTNLAVCRQFVVKGKGFLVMTGNVGDGKSLLAVAILREFLAGKFITHNDLLLELRRSYGDRRREDVIERCQATRCLVIDDLGLSMGGKDELPMLQSILDYRYGEKLPVVITSNLPIAEIHDLLGPRLTDRFKQAMYRHLTFTGPSSRSAERQNYLAD